MTSAFQQINPHLEPVVSIRPGRTYDIPLHHAAGAGFLCSVSVEGDLLRADLAPSASASPLAEDNLVIGGNASQVLRLSGHGHGVCHLVIRHARPWLGADDPLAEEYRIQVNVVEESVQDAWEAQISVPPVSDAEVRAVLDEIDGRKPYGSRKFDFVRQALAIIAKDVAVHRHAGLDYELDQWKVEAFGKVFPTGLMRWSSSHALRRALQGFVENR